jgi:branched-chain amino acid transport system permease protein
MPDIFGVPASAFLAQMTVGLVNGSFYALLSLGLAIIFGLLGLVNFAHGALYMMGAMAAWMLFAYLGVNYWMALVLAPLIVAAIGLLLERTLIRRIYEMDHMYGMLLTFGMTLVITSIFRQFYGVSGMPYEVPEALSGAIDLGFMRMPRYRAWVICISLVLCLGTWFVIERTRLGGHLRAATENPVLTQAFGINVPLVVTLSYAFGVALAAFAGVLAAPILQVSPLMGDSVLITTFAVVVIGGLGSILGAVVTGLGVGLIEAITKVYWAEASTTVVFVIMLAVLALRPVGLFGKES